MKRISLAWVSAVGVIGGAVAGCQVDVVYHGSEQEAPCRCSDPSDVCVDGRCVDPRACPRVPCREHYRCTTVDERFDGECVCDPRPEHWEHCAPRCLGDEDCADGLFCRRPEGLCIPMLRCLSDDACAVDETCALAPASQGEETWAHVHPVCRTPVALLGPGSDCLENYQCASKRCVDERCVGACRENADCPEPERCVDGFCVVTEGPCAACGEPRYLCLDTGAHCVESCRVGAECGDTDCWWAYSTFHCGEGARRCTDDAFFVADTTYDGPVCLFHRRCWKDDDCDAGHTCVLILDEAAGYCGVHVGPGS